MGGKIDRLWFKRLGPLESCMSLRHCCNSIKTLGTCAAFCLLAAFPARAPALTITEIMYAPPANGPDLQFIEVYNETGTVHDLSGYRFSSGVEYIFPEGTFLQGRSYLVVCADLNALRSAYGIQYALGNWVGTLDPEGEALIIVSNSGVEQVEVSYRDRGRWPTVPKGTGHTLALKGVFLDSDDGVNWAPSRGRIRTS